MPLKESLCTQLSPEWGFKVGGVWFFEAETDTANGGRRRYSQYLETYGLCWSIA
jgi:hypothetical protein